MFCTLSLRIFTGGLQYVAAFWYTTFLYCSSTLGRMLTSVTASVFLAFFNITFTHSPPQLPKSNSISAFLSCGDESSLNGVPGPMFCLVTQYLPSGTKDCLPLADSSETMPERT